MRLVSVLLGLLACVMGLPGASGPRWALGPMGAMAQDPLRADLDVPIRMESNLVYREIDGVQVRADLFRPANSLRLPLVVMVHGGAWSAGDKWELRDHAREMAQAGFVAVSINYRLAPLVKIEQQLDDCRHALRWAASMAEEWNADDETIGLWGYSAGAHLVSLMALNPAAEDPAIRAVVAGGSPCDFSFVPAQSNVLAHVLGGSRAEIPEVYEEFSPLSYVDRTAPAFFLFHGDKDLLVPQVCSQRMFEAMEAQENEAEFLSVEGKGHLLSFLDLKARRQAVEFLQKHLSKDS